MTGPTRHVPAEMVLAGAVALKASGLAYLTAGERSDLARLVLAAALSVCEVSGTSSTVVLQDNGEVLRSQRFSILTPWEAYEWPTVPLAAGLTQCGCGRGPVEGLGISCGACASDFVAHDTRQRRLDGAR